VLNPRGGLNRYALKGPALTTLNPIVLYVYRVNAMERAALAALDEPAGPDALAAPFGARAAADPRSLVFVKEYVPEERVMRLRQSVIASPKVLVRDLVRGVLGSRDDQPVAPPENFMVWEEVRRRRMHA
jgi:hypothetical protein